MHAKTFITIKAKHSYRCTFWKECSYNSNPLADRHTEVFIEYMIIQTHAHTDMTGNAETHSHTTEHSG